MLNKILNSRRIYKQLLVMSVDVTLALLSTWLAYSLRLETVHRPIGNEWWIYLLSPALALPIFIRLGLYRAIFRYSGFDALIATGQAISLYAAIHFVVMLWIQWPVVPLTLGLLQPILFLLLVGTSRIYARIWLTGLGSGKHANQTRLLIYGAGLVGAQTASAIQNTRGSILFGFVDDDPVKKGKTINGVPIFSPDELADIVERFDISDILLAIPSVSREERNKIIRSLQQLSVHIRSVPNLIELASGRGSLNDYRELDIEDLLVREPVKAEEELLNNHQFHHCILVTGAGGSIGSELCRQILQRKPRTLLLLEHSEFALYVLHRELQAFCQSQKSDTELIPLLASVTNRRRLDWIFATYKPDTVYHAAAYKHVPMVECNPSEGMVNNVFGTLNVAQAAIAEKVKDFVLISTDKAVRPTNLMGASKRMAELALQALADRDQGCETCFSMVRFGNVLGSSGSVIPLFRDQLARGGPLTVTHPDVTRYFMTIPEAVQLVLQAAIMAKGGEVFVLEMGEAVKVIDLAHRLISLSGHKVKSDESPEGDIQITFIGLRPGEKLYEELLIGDNPSPTPHPRIMMAHEEFLSWDELTPRLEKLLQACNLEDLNGIKAVILSCVHGYHEAKDTDFRHSESYRRQST
jgi:FlaA1/EpsC-like NDP-sugar epimerase